MQFRPGLEFQRLLDFEQFITDLITILLNCLSVALGGAAKGLIVAHAIYISLLTGGTATKRYAFDAVYRTSSVVRQSATVLWIPVCPSRRALFLTH